MIFEKMLNLPNRIKYKPLPKDYGNVHECIPSLLRFGVTCTIPHDPFRHGVLMAIFFSRTEAEEYVVNRVKDCNKNIYDVVDLLI